jgi:phosphoglycolate phosphatase (TIGR01487 family)
VIIATGNVLCFARTVSTLLGTESILIGENGGVVECGEVHYNTAYMKKCEEAFELLTFFHVCCVIMNLTAYMKKCEEAFELLSRHFPLERLNSELRKTEIGLRRDFDVEKAKQLINKIPEVELIDTGFAVHIKSRRVNKGVGLKKVAELMGLEVQDFAAIGDSPNDIEMLKVAGFGIAVSNAHPELKKIADMVTKGEHGAGVSEAIQYLKQKFF